VILADTLRDRTDDVIERMERQFVMLTPTLEPLLYGVLAGDPASYRDLQSVGRELLAPMIDRYGLAAGELAGKWYDSNRDLAGVGGAWAGAYIQDPNLDTGPLIGGSVKMFVTPESLASGIFAGMDLRVRQSGTGTVMDSALRDPQATGWGRSSSAGCCSYCGMLAARGAVYRTQHTATFCPHLRCKCQAIPAWGGSTVSMRSREDTIATRRKLSADPEEDKRLRAQQNKQARSWIEQNKATLGLQ
jgi:hypothetical protein